MTQARQRISIPSAQLVVQPAPDDIANFTNRSPHPMLHLLREASIDRAVAAFPDAAAIYERNIETLRRLGHDGWRRLWLSDNLSFNQD
jgi:hypothetical protein